MSKAMKVVLVVSLVLNAAMAAGFLVYKDYVREQGFELAALNAEAEGRALSYVLRELESNDPQRIELLKERLRGWIESGELAEEMWEQAAER